MAHPGVDSCGLRLAGDARANVAPGILSLHGLFVLNHNWWARKLAADHPEWAGDDEMLFQVRHEEGLSVRPRATVKGHRG